MKYNSKKQNLDKELSFVVDLFLFPLKILSYIFAIKLSSKITSKIMDSGDPSTNNTDKEKE